MSSDYSLLAEIADVIDSSHQTPTYVEHGVPMARVTDVKYGTLNLDSARQVSIETFRAYSRRYKAKPRDIIISRVGSYGNTAWVVETEFCLGQNVASISPKAIDARYLFFALNSSLIWSQIESKVVGSTQKTLSLKAIKEFKIPRFGKTMERNIGALLGALDDHIALLRETNATLEAIAQALFKSWFVDFDPVHAKQQGGAPEDMDEATAALFPDSFEESELGLVPRGWRCAALADAYEINPQRKLKKGLIAPYLDMANVPTASHCPETVVQREMGSGSKFQNGDTLLARITPCLENGKSAFVDFLRDGETGWGSTEFVVLCPKPPIPEYHAYLLCRHAAFREFAVQSMSGTSGRQRIQNDVLGRYLLAVPTEPVALAFSAIVKPIQQKIAANHAQAQTLATLRDTLLPRLISGQLRLPETEISADEVTS